MSIKRGLDIELLDNAIRILTDGNSLPVEYKDHPLSGNRKGHRE
ncbi:MAG: type II toxin-antitoxin system YafQ family toxin [Peptococcaceae bacterium]